MSRFPLPTHGGFATGVCIVLDFSCGGAKSDSGLVEVSRRCLGEVSRCFTRGRIVGHHPCVCGSGTCLVYCRRLVLDRGLVNGMGTGRCCAGCYGFMESKGKSTLLHGGLCFCLTDRRCCRDLRGGKRTLTFYSSIVGLVRDKGTVGIGCAARCRGGTELLERLGQRRRTYLICRQTVRMASSLMQGRLLRRVNRVRIASRTSRLGLRGTTVDDGVRDVTFCYAAKLMVVSVLFDVCFCVGLRHAGGLRRRLVQRAQGTRRDRHVGSIFIGSVYQRMHAPLSGVGAFAGRVASSSLDSRGQTRCSSVVASGYGRLASSLSGVLRATCGGDSSRWRVWRGPPWWGT